MRDLTKSATTKLGRTACVAAIVAAMAWPVAVRAQKPTSASGPQTSGSAAKPAATQVATPPVATPPGYVIGPDDVLSIGLWKDPTLNGDVVVRPDGKISFAFLNEIQAAGLTPEQLRAVLTTALSTYQQDPTVTLVVKQINSRKVYITGEVGKPGTYAMTERMTVLNLISVAGGLTPYAHKDNISVVRMVNGVTTRIAKVNYDDIIDGKAVALKQNIELKPGDQVIVP